MPASLTTVTPLIPVILCGGTGTRLWPLSRASYPKQYWPLGGNVDDTFLQQTQKRLAGIEALGNPLLICNEDHSFIVAEQMRQIDVEPGAILLEPMGRNTAPAVAVAALQATAKGGTTPCCSCWLQTTSSVMETTFKPPLPQVAKKLKPDAW